MQYALKVKRKKDVGGRSVTAGCLHEIESNLRLKRFICNVLYKTHTPVCGPPTAKVCL